jgi:hypothetical protein
MQQHAAGTRVLVWLSRMADAQHSSTGYLSHTWSLLQLLLRLQAAQQAKAASLRAQPVRLPVVLLLLLP